MRKWCANLRMEPRANHARICMSHFPPEAMGNKKLRANAVPTQNLGHNEPLEYDNAQLIATAMKARNVSRTSDALLFVENCFALVVDLKFMFH